MGILSLELPRDNLGNITADPADYDPPQNIKDRTLQVRKDFELANAIMNRPYREFNDMSLIDRISLDQMSFNTYQEPFPEDPDMAWHSMAVRPITRNKVISIAAHITGAIMFPQIFAQNDNDEEDREAAIVMRDLMEWVADRSKYDQTFVFGVISALVNPGVIINLEFSEIFRTIKEIQPDGKWKKKQIIDEVMSGFRNSIVPLDELFIGDIYEHDLQKQPFIIRRRVIPFVTAESKYKDNPTFKQFVRPGLQLVISSDSATFYEQWDDSLEQRLVEEVIYYNRTEDLQLTFVNGVLLDNVDNPNPRQDKSYPFVKSGYELFDEGKFFYYKSLVNKIGPDKDIVDELYRMIIDGTFLQLMPPLAVFGEESISSSIMTPGGVTAFKKDTSKIQPIGLNQNLAAGSEVLNRVEDSVSESSQDVLQSGQSIKGSQTAFEVSRLEQNARTQLGLFGKMVGFLVRDFGQLLMNSILQYLTVGEVMEVSSSGNRMRFRNFILPDKMVDGRKKTKIVEMDANLPTETTDKDLKKMEFDVLKRETKDKGLDGDKRIFRINPELFRRLKFLVKVAPDISLPVSDNIKKALNLEAYDRIIQNPLANQEAALRKLLLNSFEATRDNPDEFISGGLPRLLTGRLPEAGTPTKTINSIANKEARI